MSGRHQPLNGADSAEALDGLYIGPIQHDEALIRAGIECWCRDCELNRLDARLGEYRVTDETHWAANE